MLKIELNRAVATRATNEEVKYTLKDVDTILKAYAEVVIETLQSGDDKEKVPAPGLGNWAKKSVAERSGVSALDGKAWKKPAHTDIVMKISPAVKTLS